ncbi:glycine-rich domain-containing protein [Caenispirillum bisanense]
MWLRAGNYTFTVPANVYELWVYVWGAGGGGATSNNGGAGCARGGAGGGYSFKRWAVQPGDTVTITVGAGGVGAGPGSAMVNGTNGGTTSVTINGVTVQATGGEGGKHTPAATVVGGVGSGGDVNRSGGSTTAMLGTSLINCGQGGASSGSPFGNGFPGANLANLNSSVTGGLGGAGWGGSGGDLWNTGGRTGRLRPAGAALMVRHRSCPTRL